uniref:chitinase n=1 Tax=Comamonas sp. J9 TaxID=1282948 RepID=U5IKC9_9BURK|nr:chitinase [Comamonas sp. J9]
MKEMKYLAKTVLASSLVMIGSHAMAADCATAWSASTTYANAGQTVSLSGHNYSNKWWTLNEDPSKSGEWGVWKDLGTCGAVTPTATPVITATPKPTASPTPTVAPTATPVVTATPTAKPTATPVVTATPTTKPTATPVVTAAPTATPVVTAAPTATPTAKPTATPVVTIAPTATPVVTAAPTATPVGTATPTPAPVGSREVGSYFTQWGVYDSAFFAKAVQDSGAAAKLTFINYAFGNIYKQADGTIKRDSGINKANDGNTAGDGGDAWADYQMDHAAKDSVDGVADVWENKLKGNFNQLKKLKAKNPNLKIFISLGGWTWSRFFSTAASTDANRKALVSSCIDVYLKGNLKKTGGDPAGGAVLQSVFFDGIDIDWEYPGVQGIGNNVVDAVNDKHNLTLLMAEFRKQLDAYSATQNGKKFYLTAAIGAGSEKIDQTEPAEYSKSMDWVNIMTYDFHGDWDTSVNFHSHLYPDPADPQRGTLAGSYNIDDAVTKLLNNGMPADKIVLGIPYYGRGFGGVNTSVNNGLYQAKTKSPALVGVQTEAGYGDYKALVNLAGPRFYHPTTKQLYMYTATGDWWSYDDVTTIRLKNDYVKAKGLRGNFSWALDGDDSNATLTKAMAEVK